MLAGGHLIQWQELQHALAGFGEPRRQGGDVANFPDSPTDRRRRGKERNQYTRPSSAGRFGHGTARRKRRSAPVAKDPSGTRRLTTRNDSRGKSKKYPGCTSTPSSCTRSTTRSSSDRSVGTCTTAYQPPAEGRTRHEGHETASSFNFR